ncbi:MAG: restriction endonuclease subunit S [Atopobium sp.]|nr:restriction endonuclease subunit S [Atopobium sp.]
MSSEKSLTPRIRFKGFTEAWEQRKLKDLFAYGGSGGTPSSGNRDYYNGNIPFLNISDLKERNIRFTEKQITTLGLCNSAAWIVPAGSISLAMYASVGKVGIICNDIATSQAFYNMVIQDIFVRNFLYTRLEKADICNEWEPYISTGTQRNLNAEKVRDFKIKIPSRYEMNHIGSIFEVLDSLITLHQRKLDALKKIKSALLEKMFPKDGSNIPEIRFTGFTEAWEQRKLGDYGFVQMCRRIYKDQTSEIGDVPFYKIGTFGSQPDAFISKSLFQDYRKKYPFPSAGTPLISAAGSIGRTVVYQGEEAYFQDSNIVWLDNNEKLNNVFLNSLYKKIDWKLEGSTIKRLYNKDILNAEVCVPSTIEQCQVGLFFARLDSLITLHQRKLDALKKIKSALLEKMFV